MPRPPLTALCSCLALLAGIPANAATPLQLADLPDGAIELRRDGATLAKLTLQTPALRRGQPEVREVSVEGHAIA